MSSEGTKHIRQAANNTSQPCQWPSHQIHRISRGTPPWTTDPCGLPSARLCIQQHQSQRGGPPSWGQGTWQRHDDLSWHTRERHFVLSAMNNRTRPQQITTCTYMHACNTMPRSVQHTYCYTHHIHVCTLQVHNCMTIFNIQIQH